jgi:NhaA family Na+:H+ antiporter
MQPPPRPPLPPRPIERITRPIRHFLHIESASGVVLLLCTVVALVVANSPAAGAFHHFWETHLRIGVGRFGLDEPLHFWVNDALMVLFFFVVGLEIKRELIDGELNSFQKAALPVVGAIGGMLVPAGIYLALQWGQPSERGWGIPMATDIAFVVGVLALFGPRVPFGLKIFLLSLAIVDDVGAILVIAAAYSGSPHWLALGLAALGFAVIYAFNRLGVRAVWVYAVLGVAIWLAVLKSGIHPTIAGVLLGLFTPSRAWVDQHTLHDAIADVLMRVSDNTELEVEEVDYRRLEFAARESLSPLHRLGMSLHPWVSFIIMPVFALANAGVEIQPAALRDPIALAVAAGLVLGKPLGIVGLCFVAVTLGVAKLPTGVNWKLLIAAGCLGGIGFTMSLFVAGLAFPEVPAHLDAGKVGILIGSAASAILGSGLLLLGLRRKTKQD